MNCKLPQSTRHTLSYRNQITYLTPEGPEVDNHSQEPGLIANLGSLSLWFNILGPFPLLTRFVIKQTPSPTNRSNIAIRSRQLLNFCQFHISDFFFKFLFFFYLPQPLAQISHDDICACVCVCACARARTCACICVCVYVWCAYAQCQSAAGTSWNVPPVPSLLCGATANFQFAQKTSRGIAAVLYCRHPPSGIIPQTILIYLFRDVQQPTSETGSRLGLSSAS